MQPVTAIASVALIIVAGFGPIVPQQMTWLYAYEHDLIPTTTVGTTTISDSFKFQSGENGKAFRAVFKDTDGNLVEVAISEAEYRAMGLPGGEQFNPKKDDYLTLFQALTQTNTAKAAITLDSTLGVGPSASATSYTQAMTIAGANSMLTACSFNNNNLSTETATWNGTSMTIATSSSNNSALWNYLFYLGNPTLGTHNIVVSSGGGSTNLWIYAGNFNGVANAAPTAVKDSRGNNTSPITNVIVTTTDNSLHVACIINENGSTQTVQAGTQLVITDGTPGTHGLYASNPYQVTPAASNSIGVTATTPTQWVTDGAVFAPAPASTPSQGSDFIILN